MSILRVYEDMRQPKKTLDLAKCVGKGASGICLLMEGIDARGPVYWVKMPVPVLYAIFEFFGAFESSFEGVYNFVVPYLEILCW
jgi:hypothetical protein